MRNRKCHLGRNCFSKNDVNYEFCATVKSAILTSSEVSIRSWQTSRISDKLSISSDNDSDVSTISSPDSSITEQQVRRMFPKSRWICCRMLDTFENNNEAIAGCYDTSYNQCDKIWRNFAILGKSFCICAFISIG